MVTASIPSAQRARRGSRTPTPLRAGGFKPPASAVPPSGPRCEGTGGPARGRAGRDDAGAGGLEQRGPEAQRRVAREAVGDEHAFDHVGDDLVERALAEAHRHDRPARVAADRAGGAGDPGRAAERRDGQARTRPTPSRLREATPGVGRSRRSSTPVGTVVLTEDSIAPGCDSSRASGYRSPPVDAVNSCAMRSVLSARPRPASVAAPVGPGRPRSGTSRKHRPHQPTAHHDHPAGRHHDHARPAWSRRGSRPRTPSRGRARGYSPTPTA